MDCHQTGFLMMAHLAGSETAEEREALRMHLDTCPACRGEAGAIARTWEAMTDLPDARVPSGVWDRIGATLPAAAAARRSPTWAATAFTASAALLIFILGSLIIPYERAVTVCSEGVNRLLGGHLPDPALFFAVGFLFSVVPLGLAALAAAARFSPASRPPGLAFALVFAVFAVPYAVIACLGLPVASTASLGVGILTGALAGGPAGLWAGGRLIALAQA